MLIVLRLALRLVLVDLINKTNCSDEKTLGINWFDQGHLLKFTAEVTYLSPVFESKSDVDE